VSLEAILQVFSVPSPAAKAIPVDIRGAWGGM
jgi:hypothetical protein